MNERLKEFTLFSPKAAEEGCELCCLHLLNGEYIKSRDRGALGEDKQQLIQAAILKLPVAHQKKTTIRVVAHWNKGPERPLGRYSSLQVFKTSLDKTLNHLIELALIWGGRERVGPDALLSYYLIS